MAAQNLFASASSLEDLDEKYDEVFASVPAGVVVKLHQKKVKNDYITRRAQIQVALLS